MNRRALLATTAGTALSAASGCLSIAPFNTPRADDLLRSVAAEYEKERSVTAIRVVRSGRDYVTQERTQQYWRLGPDRVRSEVRWSTDRHEVGNVRVADESVELEYKRSDDIVLLRGRTDDANPADRIADDYSLEYVGTDRIGFRTVDVVDAVATVPEDGRSVSVRLGDTEYVLPLSSSDGTGPVAGESIRKRLWIDTELPIFVKERSEVATSGERTLIDERRNFAIGAGRDVDEERFELDPRSAHVSVLKSIPSDASWGASSRSRIADRVPFPLPDPDLPDGYGFDDGRVKYDADGDVVGVRLWYEHERRADRPLFVTVSTTPLLHAENRGYPETRIARDDDPRAIATLDVENVEWKCDGRTYRVGSHPDRELLVEIRESIDC